MSISVSYIGIVDGFFLVGRLCSSVKVAMSVDVGKSVDKKYFWPGLSLSGSGDDC